MQLLRKCWKDKQMVHNGEGRESHKDNIYQIIIQKITVVLVVLNSYAKPLTDTDANNYQFLLTFCLLN